jgi:hypothetical protein
MKDHSEKLFGDAAAAVPCTCPNNPIYYRDGCECTAIEKVVRALRRGLDVQPLTPAQREYLVSDTDLIDPGPWNGLSGSDRDIADEWTEAVSNYVNSM